MYAATIYVDAQGNTYGASQTDQRYTSRVTDRTVHGRPVELAGVWYGSQMRYRPFRDCVALAATRASERMVAHA